MPEIFRLFDFTYYFFSREHEPVHVHIEGAEGYAVYELEGNEFKQRYARGIKTGDLRRIESVLRENTETVLKAWERHFYEK